MTVTPVLDRIPFQDDRSRGFGVARVLKSAVPVRRKRVWTPRSTPLDQGREGACVAFGWSGELAATPQRHIVDDASALRLYERVRAQDRAMGNNFSAGATVLAGAKACKADGTITAYHWAFGLNDVIAALVSKGPVILGINWYESMYETEAGGLVRVGGQLVGGHCIMANGFWPNHPQHGDVVVWTNSWGKDYGINGTGFIRTADLELLLHEQGEACVPTDARPAR